MQPLKPEKDNTYAILQKILFQNNNIESHITINIIWICFPAIWCTHTNNSLLHISSPMQVDEIKSKDRAIFSLEKEVESTTGYLQKLQLQKDVLDDQLFLTKETECGLGSPKREIPGRAGDGAEHCGSPVRPTAHYCWAAY